MVKLVVFISLFAVLLVAACNVGKEKDGGAVAWEMTPAGTGCDTVSIENMDIKNPFIIYDAVADIYCNGHVWTSKELRTWTGPYNVLRYDTASWVGSNSVIAAPEIHKHNGRYYYLAAFENGVRKSCTTLVADNITGMYMTIDNRGMLLDSRETAVHPNFCADEYGAGYMIYNRKGGNGSEGTVQIVRFTDDLGQRMGEAYIMFRASDIPWQRSEELMPVLESPALFYSGNEGLGILFVAYCGEEKCIGVAYSQTGTLNGPWVVEKEPLLKGFASVSMFTDYDGTAVIVAEKEVAEGKCVRSLPVLIKTDLQLEKLEIKGRYKF